ncbi:hypothetical protein O209_08700 [Lactiplantibacillus plantarum WHE 92]|jgi:hypothetical protein|nr:hypothetical protein H073_00370 [Lactiplantibacillus plantarum UCMA 3037]EYR71290.1 hypothetical protein O209_08700 [Lactiplantibacillus plantarum WHE 92]
MTADFFRLLSESIKIGANVLPVAKPKFDDLLND